MNGIGDICDADELKTWAKIASAGDERLELALVLFGSLLVLRTEEYVQRRVNSATRWIVEEHGL